MEITLKNIGIIENSTIKIDGLTVIAGNNNSGKTTIGKVAYSVFEATSKISEKISNDKEIFISKQLEKVWNSTLATKLFIASLTNKALIKQFKYETIDIFFQAKTIKFELLPELKHEFQLVLNIITTDKFKKAKVNENLLNLLRSELLQAIDNIDYILSNVNLEEKLDKYLIQSIKYTLLTVFSKQITPFKIPEALSNITISDNNKDICNINIKSNKINQINGANNLINHFEHIAFIDDPFILDEPLDNTNPVTFFEEIPLVDTKRFISHRKQLLSVLKAKEDTTIFEEILNQEKYQNITNKINNILPGSFDFSGEEDLYIEDGFKLNFANLATGSKLFAILKILIEKNKIDNKTLLILDEPEAHLHPDWQLTLAELLTVFVKEIGVKIILTTHSPNFLLALEANMLKYKSTDQTNYYITEENENKFINYKLVNNNLSEIYFRFAEPFSKMKIERDKYLYNSEE